MIPKIFDVSTNGENPTDAAFNAVKIALDGSLKSELKWEEQKKVAKEVIAKGLKIFWEIDLGLFSRLPCPFNDETQVKTLRFALEVFHQEIWELFKSDSLGLCLFRGSANFSESFPWSLVEQEYLQEWLEKAFDNNLHLFNFETDLLQTTGFENIDAAVLMQNDTTKHLLNLFCCQASVDYLNFIAQDLPDSLPLFLLLDAAGVKNPGHLAQILSRERFERYSCIVHGGQLPLQGLAWNDERAAFGYIARRPIALKSKELANIAICLPSISKVLPSQYQGLTEAILEMNQLELNYRVIPEPFLTMEWDQLDYVLFLPEALSRLGERMLQGFCAAGGTPVTLGRKIGLPGELFFEKWTEKLLETL